MSYLDILQGFQVKLSSQAMKKSKMKTEETQETQPWGYTIEVELDFI